MANEVAVDDYAINLDKFENTETSDDILQQKSLLDWKELLQRLLKRSELMNYVLESKKKITSLNRLQEFISDSPAITRIELLWIMYVWCTNKIEFDTERLRDTNFNDKTVDRYLKRGKLNGYSYCMLFKKLCELNGIKCMLIHGYGRGYGYKIGKIIDKKNHMWVSVYIENSWKLIDVAWGAGYCKEDLEFVNDFQPYYFLTPPELFIYQHYSEEHQFQANKITLQEFLELPLLRLEYFLNEISYLSEKPVIEINTNPDVVNFKAPKGVLITASLHDRAKNKIENSILVQRNYITSNYEINIHIPRLDRYWLRIYTGTTEDKKLKWAADFKIKLNLTSEMNFFSWCQPYRIPNDHDVYLISPTKLLMSINEVIEYKIYISNAIQVGLIDEFGKFEKLDRIKTEKNIWFTQYSNKTKGELKLVAKFNQFESYFTAYSYLFI